MNYIREMIAQWQDDTEILDFDWSGIVSDAVITCTKPHGNTYPMIVDGEMRYLTYEQIKELSEKD